MGHGNKIYSYDSFRNILTLRVAKINGLNLVKEMFNEQLENKDISLENLKMAKWNNNANNSLNNSLYEPKKGGIPVMSYRTTSISKVLKEITAVR
ncbi:hypothetical protein GL982_03545 [Spiroplasma citri]|uniref:Uncharacterized protein n=1 Tax=Spiroplasma citri TaxID=2133 RepID=A0AAJ4JY84_SPICI|nr:hypothetical protein [Spiroplasma citri]QIA68863.1 hypothetical protein GL298_04710 [Spiroplasma citri]QIA70727.1 hypothetical protein GL981_04740 [Spiroplasma citri]QIA72774.1 hypothetical protein GL982_03545 [Spiroplasma citri]